MAAGGGAAALPAAVTVGFVVSDCGAVSDIADGHK
ncbi:hypothetical protein HaLaN_30559 [Haematococcus lacustris]|uniref:Uncharacterized protein n=1 Tax=Haematococcus lacustris TaxID=44745 RepID=A0A6A0AF29_HAELA|nr:hypothetical protein HaLaN_30559 [Haematococcus lacustris]